MKSFSNFLLEKEELEQQKQKKVKKTNKPSIDVTTTNRPAEVQGRMDATNPKQGGYSRVDDSLDSKTSGKTKLGNTTKGGEVKVTKPVGTPSGDESRKLGKLNKRTGKLNFDKNAELQAKRSQRINTTTGKATPKGVENFAMNRGGYSRRNIPKSELGKIKTDARRIASNPSSRAYKEIEASINASDYAGKRAKGDPNAAKLSDVKKAIDSKKGKFGVGSANPTRLGKSGLKLPVPTTIGVKQSEVSKKAKAFGQKIEKIKQAKASEIKDPWKTSKVAKGTTLDKVGTKKYNIPATKSGGPKNPNPDYLARMQRGASGMDSNLGGGASGTPSKSTTFKDFTKKTAGKPLEVRNTSSSIVTTRKGNIIKKGADGSRSFVGTKGTGTSSIVPYTKGGDIAKKTKIPKTTSALVTGNRDFQKISSTGKLDKYMKPQKGLITKSGQKTMKSVLTKVPKAARPFAKGALNPMRNVSSLKGVGKNIVRGTAKGLGKVVGPAAGVLDYADFRAKGHSRIGSAIRAGVRTAGYYGGAALGGAAAGALGSVLPGAGTVAGGVAGGLAGGMLGSGAADWVIKGFDRVFGGKKLKDYKAKTVAGYAAKKQKKLDAYNKANPYGGKTPQLSKNKTKFDQGSFNTVKLKKSKDGSYVMPKGWKMNKGKDSTLTYKTTRLTS